MSDKQITTEEGVENIREDRRLGFAIQKADAAEVRELLERGLNANTTVSIKFPDTPVGMDSHEVSLAIQAAANQYDNASDPDRHQEILDDPARPGGAAAYKEIISALIEHGARASDIQGYIDCYPELQEAVDKASPSTNASVEAIDARSNAVAAGQDITR